MIFFSIFSSKCKKISLLTLNLKIRIEKFEIKTESVKTSHSVSGINSDGLTEKSKTSGLIQWKECLYSFIVLHKLINVNTIEKN